jgi:hypothetical protein
VYLRERINGQVRQRLVALSLESDLSFCAKHLFVAAIGRSTRPSVLASRHPELVVAVLAATSQHRPRTPITARQMRCWCRYRREPIWTGSSPWPGRGAGGPTAGIAERRGAVGVAGGRACGSSRCVAERLGAVAVSRDRADCAPAGITKRSLVLRRRGRDHGKRKRGDGECLHCFILLACGSVARQAARIVPASLHSTSANLAHRS